MNIGPAEETVSSSNTELIFGKAMTIDETGNTPITFYCELTSLPNDNNMYEVIHILVSSFNYELQHVLQSTFVAITKLQLLYPRIC